MCVARVTPAVRARILCRILIPDELPWCWLANEGCSSVVGCIVDVLRESCTVQWLVTRAISGAEETRQIMLVVYGGEMLRLPARFRILGWV